jgi:hypothetical protein
VAPPQEVETPVVDTRSSASTAQPPLLSVQGPPQLSPPRVNAGVTDDATPTPHEAAWRLAWFTEEVQNMRASPLIANPPRQMGVNQKEPPATTEQADRRSTAGAHSDLQAGRGASHAEGGLRTAGSSSFIRVEASIRRLVCRELDVERSRGSGGAVLGDQC